MRSGKRALAGVAAGALAIGMISIAGAGTATAAKSIKPKATATATATAVRATGGTLSIPAAKLSWVATGAMTSSTVKLTTAPSSAAIMGISPASSPAADDTVTLSQTGLVSPNAVGDDTSIRINVDVAGLYAGYLTNNVDTVSFSFTTAGAPTSLTITPATQTVLVGGQANVTVTLKDAAGNTTQPQTVDAVTVSSSGDDTIYSTVLSGGLVNTKLQYGTADDSIATQTAGTSTITGTPSGTLPGSGVTAATATLVKSGTVSAVAVAGLSVTTPASASNAGTMPTKTAKVAEGTTNVVVTVDDTTSASAGNSLRFKASLSAGGTINGVPATSGSPLYIDATTDSSKKATLNLTVGGAGALNASVLTVTQVKVDNSDVTGPVTETITWQTPAVQPVNIVPNPTAALAQLGSSTTVSVQVDDSFGADQAGWTVSAYRGSVSPSNFLSSGVTNSSGTASVTVSPLPSVVNLGTETYVYQAQPPVGLPIAAAALPANQTVVTYTTSGGISTLSVAASGTGSTTFNNTTSTVVTAPQIWVPDDTAAVPTGTSAGAFTVATGAETTAPTGNLATFTATTVPATTYTVTVPEGLYVKATAPTSWNDGAAAATVASGSPVYVWGTKAGVSDVTITSGGLTLTGKIKIVNRAQDAYNMAVSPATSDINQGAFGTLTLTATDYWGNTVAGAPLTATASGQVLLGGYSSTQNVTTGASGTASVTVVAGVSVGNGLVTITPNGCTLVTCPAWAAGYTKPASFTTAPVTSAAATITVVAPVTQSIVIVGERTTVSGKSGIRVDGTTEGFAEGDIVNPYVKFPGETSYSMGIDKTVDMAGEFSWQRKTGKKAYVYFKSADGTVKSNTIIIPAA